ncbi:MAG TPA: preprotein translocase subunit YajC [Frankiaceae bacterium]|nr:preprotein translocase subunit YajC [Frankiaceae bacterium]
MILLAQEQQGSPLGSLVLLLPLVLAFYFVGIRPGRKRMQQLREVQAGLTPGREVITTAGLYGTVTGVDEADGTFTLEIAPGVEAKFARGAIMKLVEETEPAPAGEEPAAAGGEE